MQALVRLPIMQKLRDERAGLDTAGFISGYRGSPAGRLRPGAVARAKHPEASVKFTPASTRTGATMVWGTQQTGLFRAPGTMACSACGTARPGVDRCGDVFKHANAAGTSSSTAACWRIGGRRPQLPQLHPAARQRGRIRQRDDAVLNPAGVQDILDMGCWLGDVALHRALVG